MRSHNIAGKNKKIKFIIVKLAMFSTFSLFTLCFSDFFLSEKTKTPEIRIFEFPADNVSVFFTTFDHQSGNGEDKPYRCNEQADG